jgi:TRAP-type mannitol/chloroaromatic compound transport system permease large subunit
VAVIFGVLTQGVDLFGFMPYRIMSVMQNTILMAVPLFIFLLLLKIGAACGSR